ncbi:MAG TPA: hypothetical protein VFW28_02625 [Micropepsaceae bacterium]|nr:hypothetical protein [Micropepsaceae bacterium]
MTDLKESLRDSDSTTPSHPTEEKGMARNFFGGGKVSPARANQRRKVAG